ncbi:hypothetical protein P3G22_22460, partial [Rhodopseudomonas sp. BAL398]|nr:hypothetical protein [Rhodopseudomonas sp. BAL398]
MAATIVALWTLPVPADAGDQVKPMAAGQIATDFASEPTSHNGLLDFTPTIAAPLDPDVAALADYARRALSPAGATSNFSPIAPGYGSAAAAGAPGRVPPPPLPPPAGGAGRHPPPWARGGAGRRPRAGIRSTIFSFGT